MSDASRPARRLPAWAPLAATCLGQGMVVLDATIVNVALPAIRRSLHLSATDLQWVINAYLLTLGGLILLGGRIGDHYGRKRVYLIGGAIFSLASLAGGFAPSGGVLLGARAVQGVGAALLAPGTLSLLTTAYRRPRERTRALAVWSATSAGGGAVGILLGGVLTSAFGWRSVLFVNVVLGVLVIALGSAALEETSARHAGQRLDVPGALTITAALTALVYGVVETASYSWGSPRTLGVLGASVALFALAAVIERHSPNPLIPFFVLRRGAVATAVAMMLMFGAIVNVTLYFQSLYLQQVRGFDPLDAGLLMMPFAILVILTPPLAVYLTGRYGPRAVAIGSLAVWTGGLVWLSRWGIDSSVATGVVVPMLVAGLGGALCYFSVSVLLTSEIEHEYSGLGSGLFNAGRQIGASIGLAALAVVAASHTRALAGAGREPSHSATAAGYGFALLIAACLAGAMLALVSAHTMSRTRSRRRLLEPMRSRDAQPSEGSGR